MIDSTKLVQNDDARRLLWYEGESSSSALVWEIKELGLKPFRLRGRKMRDPYGLWDEFAAALQFPGYFGENWNAFDECLSDLDWLLPATGYVLVIEEPSHVLDAEPDDELEVLVRLMRTAAETFAEPIDLGEWWDRPAMPFAVILYPQPGSTAEERERWTCAGGSVVGWA